jgi:hypothetical protein
MADRPDRPSQRPELAHLALQNLTAQVLPHPGSVPTRENQPVVVLRTQIRPAHGRPELPGLGQPPIELLRLRLSPQPPEDHPAQQPRIRRQHSAFPLPGEHHLMPGIREHMPRNGHLGHIEIVIRQRHQNPHTAHPIPVPSFPATP